MMVYKYETVNLVCIVVVTQGLDGPKAECKIEDKRVK